MSPPSGSEAASRPTPRASSRSSCSGCEPARALVLARDTGVLTRVIPEFASGDRLLARLRPAAAAARRAPVRRRPERRRQRLEPRGAARRRSSTISASPTRATATTTRGSELRSPTRSWSGSATRPACATTSSGSSPHHGFKLEHSPDARDARRFLAEHGDELANDLIDHKAGRPCREERSRPPSSSASRSCDGWCEQERSQPHHLSDLAVTGDDLRAIGFARRA